MERRPLAFISALKQRIPDGVLRRVEHALLPYRPQARSWVCGLIPPQSSGAEVGVWRGDFSEVLLYLAEPARLHLVDPWSFQPTGQLAEAMYGSSSIASQAAMDEIAEGVRRRFADNIAAGQVVIGLVGPLALMDRTAPGTSMC